MAVNVIAFPSSVSVADSERLIAPPASGASGEDISLRKESKNNLNHHLPAVISVKKVDKDGPAAAKKTVKIKTEWLDNSFQQALLRAQERLTAGYLPREQEEWRLPHASVPARPDLSRVVPVRDEGKRRRRRGRKGRHKRSETYPKSIKEATTTTTSEPDLILPQLPIYTLYQKMFSDLSSSLPATSLTPTQPVYLPFVGSASLHPKSMSRTVIKQPLTTLPELCHGCRTLTAHLHPFKGYLHLDGDRISAMNETAESGKGESEFEERDYSVLGGIGGRPMMNVCHGCAVSETPHFHYNTTDIKRAGGGYAFTEPPPPSQYSSSEADSGLYDSVSQHNTSRNVPPPHIEHTQVPDSDEEVDPADAEDHGVLFNVERMRGPDEPVHQLSIPRQKPPKIPQWIVDLAKDPYPENAAHKIRYYEDHCYACEQALRQLLPSFPHFIRYTKEFRLSEKGDDSEVASTSGIGTSIYSEADIQRLEEEIKMRAEEQDAEERERRELKEKEKIKKEEEEKERRKNLYKPPKAFSLKKQESHTTATEDPFSKERSYNLPKNSGFKVKKSNKGVTQHVEIKRDETNWKKPKQFEPKKGATKATTADWKPAQRDERLRPKTPPPPPPPVKKKAATIPIVPKKREPMEQIPSLREPAASPPRRRKEEKPKPKPKPEPKPKEEPPPKKVEKKVEKKLPTVIKKPNGKLTQEHMTKLVNHDKKSSKVHKKEKQTVKTENKTSKRPAPDVKSQEVIEEIVEATPDGPSPEPSERGISPCDVPLPSSTGSSLVSSPAPPTPSPEPTPIPSEPTPPPPPSPPPKEPTPPPVQEPTPPPPPVLPESVPLPQSPPEEPPSPSPPPKDPTPPPPKEPTPPPPPPKDPTPPPPKEATPPPPPKDPTPEPKPRSPELIIKISPLDYDTLSRRTLARPSFVLERTDTLSRTIIPDNKPVSMVTGINIPEKIETFQLDTNKSVSMATDVNVPIQVETLPDMEQVSVITDTNSNATYVSDILVTPVIKNAPKSKDKIVSKGSPKKSAKTAPASVPVTNLDEPETDIVLQDVDPEPEVLEETVPEEESSKETAPSPTPPEPVVESAPKKVPPKKFNLLKAKFKAKVPLIIKDYVRKERQVTTWKLPEIPKWKDEWDDRDLPSWPAEAPVPILPPPLPDISTHDVTSQPTGAIEEEEPEPEKEPTPEPPKPEPIVWRKRPTYKPKKRKVRRVTASTPENPSPDPTTRDALDFLARYCIVHKAKVPQYERMFNQLLHKKGVDIDSEPETDDNDEINHGSSPEKTNKPGEMLDNKRVDNDRESEFVEAFGRNDGTIDESDYVSPLNLNAGESLKDGSASGSESENEDRPVFINPLGGAQAVDDHLDKLAFTMGNLNEKTVNLQEEIQQLQEIWKTEFARAVREEFPEVLRADYDPTAAQKPVESAKKGKKKKKGKQKDTAVVERQPKAGSHPHPSSALASNHNNDDWVVGRLNDWQHKQVEETSDIRMLALRLNRANEKLQNAKHRIRNLTKEKQLVSLMGQSLRNEELSNHPAASDEFRRKQSTLYRHMNPREAHDIAISEVEPLLHQINRNLITEKECQYVYHVLDLPQRHRLDFKLFTVVAALSEKVSNLEPFIKKMINKMDFEALDVKMSRAKELFYLLEDEDGGGSGSGEVSLPNLRVELEAGGLSNEHVQMVVDKLGREGKQTVDFLDFLTYILLFIDIHDYILSDPLKSSRDR